ncbi:response regulator transcription factor [Hymenobacter jeollabukensis]|uniref:Response regulator transcription factor n=1 Tax=Hymenobacter jeollabukensis TaxID=2025313 RepID=A0A5R8WQ67_9BACT|nr:response regulator transcription factor [Hymenobacter jeollabukensis]TLM92249.1 response regulator transcription factor [Hymenobacter jeollabukensis]
MSSAPATSPPPDTIPVLLVDDHQLVLEGVRVLLQNEPDLRIAATASSGVEALRQLAAHPEVRVAVVDLNMPQMSGVQLTQAIRAAHPAVRIIVLSMFHDHTSVQEVLAAGGAGYLLKNTTAHELTDAVRRVAAGRTYFNAEVGATLLENLDVPAARDAAEQPASLTAREREILQLIAGEYSNAAIAEKLFISERTVETHRRNIFTKTKSKSIIGLIQYALKHKLIRL